MPSVRGHFNFWDIKSFTINLLISVYPLSEFSQDR